MSHAGRVETARLQLRPWTDEDLDPLLRLYGDPLVMRFISDGRPLSRERVASMLEHAKRRWREHGFGPWIALDQASGTWLGEIGLNEIPDWPGTHRVEVGWELDPAWWGRGLAPEGGRAALALGFREHGLERIISVTNPLNAPSRRVIEKIGLVYQGKMPLRGRQAVWYALDRTAWEAAQAERVPEGWEA